MYRFSPYYLFFLGDDSKKFSYAASMGTLYLPQEYLSYISKRLAKFNKLSCRDEKNTRVLSNLLKRDVEHVVDPTLLLNRDEWKKYILTIKALPIYDIREYISYKRRIAIYLMKISTKLFEGFIDVFMWIVKEWTRMIHWLIGSLGDGSWNLRRRCLILVYIGWFNTMLRHVWVRLKKIDKYYEENNRTWRLV